jgi:hypothetical protein
MPSLVLEPAIPATKQLQTYTLDHTATRIGYALTIMNATFLHNNNKA